jgi:hypothetical protein
MLKTMKQAEKSQYERLRNKALRQGLILRRSRRRDPRSLGYGTYGLYDAVTEKVQHGDELTRYGLSLSDVDQILKGES